MGKTSYVIALGSNRRHHRHGGPARVLEAACEALESKGVTLIAAAPVISTAAVGPAGRGFANSAIVAESDRDPPAMLALLKEIERLFGRRRGRRWGPRVIDLDIILWSEGIWAGAGVTVPHPGFRTRRFVLDPLVAIVPEWRDPVSGHAIRHLHARLARRRPG